MALLEVAGLTVSFGGTAVLEGVNFTLDKGQRFGIIGESGSGKTMTALAIMGLLPDGASVSGSINFDGTPLPPDEEARAKLRGSRMAMVFQEPMTSLNPLAKAGDQVVEAMELAGQAAGDLRAEVERLFVEVGLEPVHAGRYPHELS
ncbi:MAG TPA: ATP-binding cassette domain-containing protein, partial [Devosia sp.]|nr:ATP-binding cassette domain-containing protein [Devosia sp.]